MNPRQPQQQYPPNPYNAGPLPTEPVPSSNNQSQTLFSPTQPASSPFVPPPPPPPEPLVFVSADITSNAPAETQYTAPEFMTASNVPASIAAPVSAGQRSYIVAFSLSLLLGLYGIDRFYLGYAGTGVLKFLTLGGFGIWYLVDLVMIMTNHKTAQDGTALNGYAQRRKLAIIILLVVVVIYSALIAYSVYAFNKFVNN